MLHIPGEFRAFDQFLGNKSTIKMFYSHFQGVITNYGGMVAF